MEILIAILSSSVVATIIGRIFTLIDKRQAAKNGLNQGMRLILKDRLRFLCLHYIQQGWIYEDELEDIIAMHSCYHDDLKGNGYLDLLISKVKALEIKGAGV